MHMTHKDIQWDICSFGNLATTKEHWLHIYPPLSHFDHLVRRLKSTVLVPSTDLYKIVPFWWHIVYNTFDCTTDI